MKPFVCLLATLSFTTFAPSANAAPILLNFDTDLQGNPLAGGTALNTAYPNLGVTFSANAQIVLGSGGVSSQPNFAAGTPLFAGTIELIFDGTTDFIQAVNVSNSTFTLTAFDVNNNVIGTTSANNFLQTATISTPGIARATFSTNTQFGIDDLSFNTPTPIPEPATLVVFGLLGAAGFGYVRRRLKSAPLAA